MAIGDLFILDIASSFALTLIAAEAFKKRKPILGAAASWGAVLFFACAWTIVAVLSGKA